LKRGYCALCDKRTFIDNGGRCIRGHWAEGIHEPYDGISPGEPLPRVDRLDLEPHEPAPAPVREVPPMTVRRKLWVIAVLIVATAVSLGALLLLVPLKSRSGDTIPSFESRTEWVNGVTLKEFAVMRLDPVAGVRAAESSAFPATDPELTVSGKLIGVTLPVSVSARLTYLDTLRHTDTSPEIHRANGNVLFRFPRSGERWPAGHYRAAIMVDGSPAGIAEFEVR
jgi:hypothetical protein